MAIDVGSLIEVTTKMSSNAGQLFTVWSYEVGGTFTALPAAEIAAGWWNDVSTVYRALVQSSAHLKFSSVVVREMNDSAGDLAEWSIPSGEQAGTRAQGTEQTFLPFFISSGVRLTVGSRLTRPGQKRIPGALEADNDTGVVTAAYKALLVTFFDHMTATMTLPIPALGMDLVPSVFSKDATGVVTAHQPVVGYVINDNLTSQVSRRPGNGL